MYPIAILLNSRILRSVLAIPCVVLAVAVPASIQAEQSITLAWNPSPGGGVAGYYVYAWEEDAESPLKIDAGAEISAPVSGLKEGLSYTFHVTAYNAFRLESTPSEPLAYSVPVPLRLVPPTSGPNSSRLQFPAAPGRWYELQASTDLVNWTTIWQTGVANNYSWMEYQDPRTRYHSSRFYRLQVHK